MTPEELRNAAAVMLAAAEGKPIEYYSKMLGTWHAFDEDDEPVWDWSTTSYQVAITKPSIDWSHVHPDFVAMATEESGNSFLYTKIPVTYTHVWSASGKSMRAENFASFTPSTCDWKDSLVLRPTKEKSK